MGVSQYPEDRMGLIGAQVSSSHAMQMKSMHEIMMNE
jgi:hypothetical protein